MEQADAVDAGGALLGGLVDELRTRFESVNLAARGRVLHPALVERAVRDLLLGAPGGLHLTTRDVRRSDSRGVSGPWVEVVVHQPGLDSTHAQQAASVAPLLWADGEKPLVEVSRTPGRGTIVRLLLPCVDPEGAPETGPVLLLVDDDDLVRECLGTALRAHGYRVIDAPHGQAALDAVEQHEDAVDLLLTDVVMPWMGGLELARRLSARDPGLKTLFLTGLPLPAGVVLPGPWVMKPLDLLALSEQLPSFVKALLELPPDSGSPGGAPAAA